MKKIVIYEEPKDLRTAAILTDLNNKGLFATNYYRLDQDPMRHNPGVSGQTIVIIDVDATTYAVFPADSFDIEKLVLAFSQAPNNLPKPPVPPKQISTYELLLRIAVKLGVDTTP